MKTFVRRILMELGFSIDESCLGDESSFQADRTEDKSFDFLTVSALDEYQFTLENVKGKMEDFYNSLIESRNGIVGIDKNLSLLILLKVNSNDLPLGVKSLIFDVEEDPYTFKKYVLTFTSEQESLLLSMFEKSGMDVTKFLYKILNDAEYFSAFKFNQTTENALIYDLISKLFIKLPYLNIKNQNREINLVSKEIISAFSEEDRKTWDALMDLKEREGTDADINKILGCLGVVEVE